MGSTGLRPVVFVDRDGVLIENCPNYVQSWSDVEIFDQAVRAGKLLTAAGLPLVVVTNQQLVGKGILPLDTVATLNDRILDCFRSEGVEILARYMCPHLKDDDCDCRKPRPGMLLKAAKEHSIDLENSFLVGDATTDLLAAEAAGVTGILVRTGRGIDEEPKVADIYNSRWVVKDDFLAATSIILGSERGVRVMQILVTGGAGFIGSVIADHLVKEGHKVVALDDLRYGHEAAVPKGADFIRADIVDAERIMSIFKDRQYDAVVHLAAEAYIDESIKDPGRFYSVNVQGGINLLEGMKATNVQRMIFSSTAAVFGEPTVIPVTEDSAKEPVNAYGETKLAFERALSWYHRSFGIRHVSFRYFNACGATTDFGEDRTKETHLIPILFEVVQGKRPALNLYGTDYPTPDKTCIRDYVHVADIAQAHILGLHHIDDLKSAAFNLGSGEGNSNLQVIEATRKVTGHPIPFTVSDRRPGDPAILVASPALAKRVLGWNPQFTDLHEMIESSWRWRSNHPQGYRS